MLKSEALITGIITTGARKVSQVYTSSTTPAKISNIEYRLQIASSCNNVCMGSARVIIYIGSDTTWPIPGTSSAGVFQNPNNIIKDKLLVIGTPNTSGALETNIRTESGSIDVDYVLNQAGKNIYVGITHDIAEPTATIEVTGTVIVSYQKYESLITMLNA